MSESSSERDPVEELAEEFLARCRRGEHYYVMQFIHGLSLDEVLVELRWLRRSTEHSHGKRGSPHYSAKPAPVLSAAVAQSLLSGRFRSGPASQGRQPRNETPEERLPQYGQRTPRSFHCDRLGHVHRRDSGRAAVYHWAYDSRGQRLGNGGSSRYRCEHSGFVEFATISRANPCGIGTTPFSPSHLAQEVLSEPF
jgi:hypothetical protein